MVLDLEARDLGSDSSSLAESHWVSIAFHTVIQALMSTYHALYIYYMSHSTKNIDRSNLGHMILLLKVHFCFHYLQNKD